MILDVGSGVGIFSDVLQNAVSAQVMCTDVVDHHAGKALFIRGNGDQLPFPDKSVDTVTLLYVLHHTDHPEKLLREAHRISRERIIVHEDVYQNLIEKLWLVSHIASFKFVSPQSGFTLKTDREWEALFKENGFHVDDQGVTVFEAFSTQEECNRLGEWSMNIVVYQADGVMPG